MQRILVGVLALAAFVFACGNRNLIATADACVDSTHAAPLPDGSIERVHGGALEHTR